MITLDLITGVPDERVVTWYPTENPQTDVNEKVCVGDTERHIEQGGDDSMR